MSGAPGPLAAAPLRWEKKERFGRPPAWVSPALAFLLGVLFMSVAQMLFGPF